MPRSTNRNITNCFSSCVDVVINWFDESPRTPETSDSDETESIQSIDSDLWGNWDPAETDFLPVPDWEDFNPEAEKR